MADETPVDTRIVPPEAGGSGTAPPAAAAPAATPSSPAPASAAASPSSAEAATAGDTPKPPTQGVFGDDWREKLSGADEKKLSRLSKYQSPQAVADALIAAQDLIAKGGHKKDVVIPESPDKYKLESEIPADAKDVIDTFLGEAHKANMTDAQVNSTLKVFFDSQKKAEEAQHDEDLRVMEQSEETLRSEWGGEFKRNINLIRSLLGDVADNLLTGRLADGTPVGSSPEVLRLLAGIALERNPMGVTVPGGGENLAATVEDEIAKIEKVMRENRSEYNRDEKMQERYRQLLDFRIKNQPKKVA